MTEQTFAEVAFGDIFRFLHPFNGHPAETLFVALTTDPNGTRPLLLLPLDGTTEAPLEVDEGDDSGNDLPVIKVHAGLVFNGGPSLRLPRGV